MQVLLEFLVLWAWLENAVASLDMLAAALAFTLYSTQINSEYEPCKALLHLPVNSQNLRDMIMCQPERQVEKWLPARSNDYMDCNA